MLKKLLITFGLLIIIAAGGLFFGYKKLTDSAQHPISYHPNQLFILEKVHQAKN